MHNFLNCRTNFFDIKRLSCYNKDIKTTKFIVTNNDQLRWFYHKPKKNASTKKCHNSGDNKQIVPRFFLFDLLRHWTDLSIQSTDLIFKFSTCSFGFRNLQLLDISIVSCFFNLQQKHCVIRSLNRPQATYLRHYAFQKKKIMSPPRTRKSSCTLLQVSTTLSMWTFFDGINKDILHSAIELRYDWSSYQFSNFRHFFCSYFQMLFCF